MTPRPGIGELLDAWQDRGEAAAAVELRRRLAASADDRADYWRWMQVHAALRAHARSAPARRSGRRAALRWAPLWRRRPLLLAALLLIGLGLAASLLIGRDGDPVRLTVAGRTSTLPIGAGYTATQPARLSWDGAELELATGGAIRVLPADPAPALALDAGRATVAVAPRQGRPPLLLRLPQVDVEVIGTRFALDASPGCSGVAVEEGQVRCRAADSPWGVVVGPGRSGTFPAAGGSEVADRTLPARHAPLDLLAPGWRLVELHGGGSRSSGTLGQPVLDFRLAGAAGAEAWAALLGTPARADFSAWDGLEICCRCPPLPGLACWVEATLAPDRVLTAPVPSSGVRERRRLPWSAFTLRQPAAGGPPAAAPPRWDRVLRIGWGADSGACASCRLSSRKPYPG